MSSGGKYGPTHTDHSGHSSHLHSGTGITGFTQESFNFSGHSSHLHSEISGSGTYGATQKSFNFSEHSSHLQPSTIQISFKSFEHSGQDSLSSIIQSQHTDFSAEQLTCEPDVFSHIQFHLKLFTLKLKFFKFHFEHNFLEFSKTLKYFQSYSVLHAPLSISIL
jgi:hypothetical protein